MAAVPMKISLLKRPISSHEDPAAGFSFTKAKPVQPLDFSRKTSSSAILPIFEAPLTSQDTGIVQAAKDAAKSSSTSGTSSKVDSGLKQMFTVPFPNVVSAISQESSHSARHAKREQHEERSESANVPQNEASMSGDDTLVEPDPETVDLLPSGDGSRNAPQEPMPDPMHSRQTPFDPTSQSPKEQTTTTKSAGRITKLPEANVHPRPKGAKLQKKRQGPLSNLTRALEPPSHNVLSNEADLVQMLLYKRRQDDQDREIMQKALRDKEAQYQDLYAASEDLYAQLKDISQRYSASEAQLSKIKEAKPGWESKLKKLHDFVKGLTHDHNRLRDDAREMSERQSTVLEEKESIVKTLREVYETTGERHSSSRQQITEARHDMEVLAHAVDHQQVQLVQAEALLSSERARNNHLEEQISASQDSHTILTKLITEHRDGINGRITELLEKYQQAQLATVPNPEDPLKPLLEQCLVKLKELPNAADGVSPVDLQKVNDSMQQHLDMINNSIRNCEQSAITTKEQQQQLVVSMQDGFQSLSHGIATEHTLSERIMDLREIKATVREQLQQTDKDLQGARLEIIRLQNTMSEQSSRIITLENETKCHQRSEDPRLFLRIQELDANGRDLQRNLEIRTTEKEDLSERLQQKEVALQHLRHEPSKTQTQLEQARQQIEAVQQAKSEYEERAILEREEMRERLSRAADQEVHDLKSKHLNALQQWKLKHASTDDRYEEASSQLVITRNEKEELEKKVADANAASQAEQRQREEQATLAGCLHHRVTELEQQLLTCRKAARNSLVQSPKVRKAPHSYAPRVVEDSQPNEHDTGEFDGSQPTGSGEDLSGLFPTTPKGGSQDLEVAQMSYSSTRVTSRDGRDNPKLEQLERKPSRELLPHPGSRQFKTGLSQSEPSKSSAKASYYQKSSQASATAPKGILKPTQHDLRGEKRAAAESEKADTAGFTAPKRRKSNMTRDLGPVVPDSQSQSPANAISGRSRKQTVVKKARKDDKWNRTFNEYTRSN